MAHMDIKITITLPDDEIAREAVAEAWADLARDYVMATRARKAVKYILEKISKEVRAC